jgi:hypothetical protein
VGGIDAGGVGQREQLAVQTVVELVGQFVAGVAERGEQVGPPDVADEESISGEDPVGHLVVGMFPDDDADRLGCVPWRVPDLELYVAE